MTTLIVNVSGITRFTGRRAGEDTFGIFGMAGTKLHSPIAGGNHGWAPISQGCHDRGKEPIQMAD